MRKSADVVILMQQNFNLSDVTILTSSLEAIEVKPLPIFDERILTFFSELSRSLMKDKLAQKYSDVVTFAFFCRKSNLQNLQKKYTEDLLRFGRGMVFHIAPSNVPINFAYSLLVGMLSGNVNVVRVSNKNFPQVDLVVRHIKALSSNFPDIVERIILVRYAHESDANAYFSSLCSVRIIWGGDDTIRHIRESLLPARSFDICFADRYSLAVIDAQKMLQESNINALAEGFYNDTYLFDQNACTAPHLVLWRGSESECDHAKKLFWNAVIQQIDKKQYNFQSIMAIDKLVELYRDSQRASIKRVVNNDNRLVRVELSELVDNIEDMRCAGGYFLEYNIESLNAIVPIVNTKFQTLSYYGFEKQELRSFITTNALMGIDRIVPIGKTTEFSLIWDGYDLIKILSRVIDL